MDREAARRYNRAKNATAVAAILLNLLLISVVVFTPLSSELAQWAKTAVHNPYGRFLLFALTLGAVFSAAGFPLSVYSGYLLEHKFGLSNQSFLAWLWRQAKAAFVGTFIAAPLGLAFYYCLRKFGVWWWLPVGTVVFVFSVVLAQLAPVLILPLFYKLQPADSQDLRERIHGVLEKGHLSLSGVYRIDLSRETRKANAALAGLGPTRRVLLADTLISKFTLGEIETVVAHEVGHHVHHHMAKLLGLGMVTVFAEFAIAAAVHKIWLANEGLELFALEGLPRLVLVLSALGLLLSPLRNWYSRWFERQADLYALISSTEPEAYPRALRKLAEQNLEDPDPPRWAVCLLYSHPPIAERIARAERWLASKPPQSYLASQPETDAAPVRFN